MDQPAGFGGVLRERKSVWILGFYGKLQDCSSLEVELAMGPPQRLCIDPWPRNGFPTNRIWLIQCGANYQWKVALLMPHKWVPRNQLDALWNISYTKATSLRTRWLKWALTKMIKWCLLLLLRMMWRISWQLIWPEFPTRDLSLFCSLSFFSFCFTKNKNKYSPITLSFCSSALVEECSSNMQSFHISLRFCCFQAWYRFYTKHGWLGGKLKNICLFLVYGFW